MNGIQLKELREKFGFSQETLAKKLNVSRKTINTYETKNDIPESKQQMLSLFFESISNKMLLSESDTEYEVKTKYEVKKAKNSNGVPYYDIDYAGGWSSEEVFANQLPSFFITSPDFEKADFACNLIGQSISRRIPHRAVIGLRQIFDWEMYFPTNEVYAVLMKNELRTVKIVKRSEKEGFLTLIPDPLPEYNQTVYESEEVPITFVSKMFQIVAWAQFERVAM
ncbi:helix-turn-helix domain-containing protein [Flavobacterium sp. CBA20B-1]|uniref:helix-turn-helix transcriptional regulator n=1 Tax=unclassified Flavobacterium TaxID=196869 RepID=UPI002224ACBC|nr:MULTISPECIES: helix-turn-helix transcriptional regulator [unclassified Flavobacterium]WCM42454.1 helix-turn-helix domain-containing protein [Flavobacterium sp. CBA20B-1]